MAKYLLNASSCLRSAGYRDLRKILPMDLHKILPMAQPQHLSNASSCLQSAVDTEVCCSLEHVISAWSSATNIHVGYLVLVAALAGLAAMIHIYRRLASGTQPLAEFASECRRGFADPTTRILTLEDEQRILQALGIQLDLSGQPGGIFALDGEGAREALKASCRALLCAAGSLGTMGGKGITRGVVASEYYRRLETATPEQQPALAHIRSALENTMYATFREFGSSPGEVADIIIEIFQQPFHHHTFAFYYKHPLYQAKSHFAISMIVCQLCLVLYSLSPWTSAADAMFYSNQARLIRHSAHRHVLVGLIMSMLSLFLFYSCVTGHGLFDKDAYDEGFVAFAVCLVHVFFGGLG